MAEPSGATQSNSKENLHHLNQRVHSARQNAQPEEKPNLIPFLGKPNLVPDPFENPHLQSPSISEEKRQKLNDRIQRIRQDAQSEEK